MLQIRTLTVYVINVSTRFDSRHRLTQGIPVRNKIENENCCGLARHIRLDQYFLHTFSVVLLTVSAVLALPQPSAAGDKRYHSNPRTEASKIPASNTIYPPADSSFDILPSDVKAGILNHHSLGAVDRALLRTVSREFNRTVDFSSIRTLKTLGVDFQRPITLFNLLMSGTRSIESRRSFAFLWNIIQRPSEVTRNLTLNKLQVQALAFAALRHNRIDLLHHMGVRRDMNLREKIIGSAILLGKKNALTYFGYDVRNIPHLSFQNMVVRAFPHLLKITHKNILAQQVFKNHLDWFYTHDIETFRFILEDGADVNSIFSDSFGNQDTFLGHLLHSPVQTKKNIEAIEFLLRNGADLFLVSPTNRAYPIQSAIQSCFRTFINWISNEALTGVSLVDVVDHEMDKLFSFFEKRGIHLVLRSDIALSSFSIRFEYTLLSKNWTSSEHPRLVSKETISQHMEIQESKNRELPPGPNRYMQNAFHIVDVLLAHGANLSCFHSITVILSIDRPQASLDVIDRIGTIKILN